MKKIVSIIYFSAIFAYVFPQYFYYYGNKKIELHLNTNCIYVNTYNATSKEQLNAIIGDNFDITISSNDNTSDGSNQINLQKNDLQNPLRAEIKIKNPVADLDYFSLIKKLKELSGIAYVAPCFFNNKSKKVDISHLFYVKLKSPTDLSQLQEMAQQTKCKIIGQIRFMPLWYIMSCDKNSSGNTMDLANQFYESEKFAAAEPDFYNNFVLSGCPPNDPLFPDQWGLQNTGQSGGTAGVDINVCPAWNITTGSTNVITAIIDCGFQLDHPDLAANVTGSGFDANSLSSPSVIDTPAVDTSHGTSCAGIIAAIQNNSIGISGVAPTTSIISVSFAGTTPTAKLAVGIIWADSIGNASVLSNSWGQNSPSLVIVEAIGDVATNGRGGLGCVVVFSAGNDDDGVDFPADQEPPTSGPVILSVGAIDRCGAQSGLATVVANSCDPWPIGDDSSSNFGTDLDVVAPGSSISTTVITGTGDGGGDYTYSFAGTSAACPYVAGVAALILSINPCLTQEQVANIIESTCSKVDTTPYATTTGRPNGTWNSIHGYGLVDAYAALNFTNTTYLQHKTETSTDTINNLGNIYAGFDVDTNMPTGDYIISSTANVIIKSPTAILFEPGFVAQAGSVMDAYIAPFTGDCGSWTPIAKMDKVSSPITDTSINTIASSPDGNLIVIFPNPFTNSFQVKYATTDNATDVAMSVYDLTGRLVYSNKESVIAGDHNYSISLNNVPSSVFFIKICVNTNCTINKIVKI